MRGLFADFVVCVWGGGFMRGGGEMQGVNNWVGAQPPPLPRFLSSSCALTPLPPCPSPLPDSKKNRHRINEHLRQQVCR